MFNLFKNMLGNFSNEEVSTAIKEGALLVDVRTSSEFASGSVKGAINIPLDQLSAKISQLKGKKNIIVFCRSGNRSSQAKSFLTKSGFTNVVDGGTWQNVRNLVEN
jgi:phage shock protein E